MESSVEGDINLAKQIENTQGAAQYDLNEVK